MSTAALITKAITGKDLTEIDRAALSPTLLAHLAAGRHIELNPSDRRRLSKVMLAQLAIGGFVKLTRPERDSLDPHALVLLAMTRRTKLHDSECARLTGGLRDIIRRMDQEYRPPRSAARTKLVATDG